MTLEQIRKVYGSMKSNYLDTISNLKQLGATLHETWTDKTNIMLLLASVSDLLNNSVVTIDDDVCDFIDSIGTSTINASNDVAEVLSFNINKITDGVYTLTDSVGTFAQVLTGATKTITRTTSSTIYALAQTQAQLLSKACGMYYALADICDTAGSTAWSSLDNITTTLTSLINSYSNALGSYTLDLVKSITHGPAALLQLISSLIDKVSDIATGGDLSELLNSTSIVLNQFAWGAVVSTIGTVLNAAATVVAAIHPIIGAIVAGVGIITQVVGRIVVSATTAFDDTQYKVETGSDTAHCFKFVIDQDRVELSGLASYMRQHGWATLNVFCPHQGLLYFMYLEDFADETNNWITYESHLSSDIDLTENLYSYKLPNTGGQWEKYYPGWKLPMTADYDKTAVFAYQNISSDNDGVILPFFWANLADGTAGTTYVQPRSRLRQLITDPDTDVIKPVDFSTFDSFKQWLGNSLANFIDVRLCSAIIVHLTYLLGPVLTDHYTYLNSSKYVARALRVKNASYTTFADSGLAKFIALFGNAWSCFVTSGGADQGNNIFKSDFGLTSTARDALLTNIQNVYDSLKYKDFTIASSLSVDVIQYYGNEGFLVKGVVKASTITVSDVEDIYSYDGLANTIQPYMHDLPVGVSWLSIYSSGYWPSSFAVDLPTLTFTGFIAGLVVDGLVILAASTVAVFATVGWVKLKNKRAQLQAKAEKKWYTWQDEGMTDEQWKDYKSARFKYNIVSWATGGTTLSLGLYDEETNTESIINTVLKGKSDLTDNNTSIDLVVKLLRGY